MDNIKVFKIMNFKTEFPKKEITIETFRKVGSLIGDEKVIVHYRNYRAYLDKVNHITLSGDKNVWYGVKSEFLYDTLMNSVKKVYTDSFGRKMKVNILS